MCTDAACLTVSNAPIAAQHGGFPLYAILPIPRVTGH
jgi:hypothetical protein